MKILVSVIIPLYNKESYIEETIDCILYQTYQNFEVIIVNDCSTDHSSFKIQNIKDKRIQMFHHQKNLGLPATRNTGISHANGDLICLLDADDLWEPSYLQTIIDLHCKFPDELFFGTDYVEKYPFGETETRKTIDSSKKNTSFVIHDFFESNLGQPIICPSSLSFKRTILSENEPIFNSAITFAEDIDFYIRYFSKYSLAYCYKPLVKHRDGNPDQMTQNNISNKNFPDFNSYQNLAEKSISLQRYIDFQRYCFAINLRMERSFGKAKQLQKDITPQHLTQKQKILLGLPFSILKAVKKVKNLLLKRNIKVSSY
ncbi:Glycosyl transferase family 2 [Pustulibacterium marinum]|uniref:Glycosyl transferase family 2 n=1 Tax=Pustulibacterium marinum TaxID=1224947 RepID=A0A1I7FW38_9FLAO|nr:glycosyltransferase family 2 protein [Pustulibacterium marinum]SFU40415.1 Glycosyl transferase family 2 [Pustulibacterium marinum]